MENSRENMYKFLAIVFPTIEFSPVKECEFKDIVIPMFVEFYLKIARILPSSISGR